MELDVAVNGVFVRVQEPEAKANWDFFWVRAFEIGRIWFGRDAAGNLDGVIWVMLGPAGDDERKLIAGRYLRDRRGSWGLGRGMEALLHQCSKAILYGWFEEEEALKKAQMEAAAGAGASGSRGADVHRAAPQAQAQRQAQAEAAQAQAQRLKEQRQREEVEDLDDFPDPFDSLKDHKHRRERGG